MLSLINLSNNVNDIQIQNKDCSFHMIIKQIA